MNTQNSLINLINNLPVDEKEKGILKDLLDEGQVDEVKERIKQIVVLAAGLVDQNQQSEAAIKAAQDNFRVVLQQIEEQFQKMTAEISYEMDKAELAKIRNNLQTNT